MTLEPSDLAARAGAAAAIGASPAHDAAVFGGADLGDAELGGATHDAEVFRSFHRGRRRELLARRAPLALGLAAALSLAGWGIAQAAPPAPPSVSAGVFTLPTAAAEPVGASTGADDASSSAPASVPPAASVTATVTGQSDAAAPGSAAIPPSVAATTSGADAGPHQPADASAPPAQQQHYRIAVTATGHQAELDACQWVRMDVHAIAPIVGAHNFCGGDIVLAMNVGDLVSVNGGALDGDYQVTGSRDAHAGDDAAQATAGLAGELLFQSCYWDSAQGLRLVTAQRVDLSLPPVLR